MTLEFAETDMLANCSSLQMFSIDEINALGSKHPVAGFDLTYTYSYGEACCYYYISPCTFIDLSEHLEWAYFV